MILFHFCIICEVQYVDNAITFKISSDDKLREVCATTASSASAGVVKMTFWISQGTLNGYSIQVMSANL